MRSASLLLLTQVSEDRGLKEIIAYVGWAGYVRFFYLAPSVFCLSHPNHLDIPLVEHPPAIVCLSSLDLDKSVQPSVTTTHLHPIIDVSAPLHEPGIPNKATGTTVSNFRVHTAAAESSGTQRLVPISRARGGTPQSDTAAMQRQNPLHTIAFLMHARVRTGHWFGRLLLYFLSSCMTCLFIFTAPYSPAVDI